jgi:RIO-like serine/threonine protein kinase
VEIGLGKESKVFVRSHPEIVRSAKGGHLAFHTKKNFLRLRW